MLAGAHTLGSDVVIFDSTSWTKAYFAKMKPTIKNLNKTHRDLLAEAIIAHDLPFTSVNMIKFVIGWNI
jgi:hypothetical protein